VKNHPNAGRLELTDLAGYQAKARTPLCGDYRSTFVVCGMPPPSSGAIAVLQTLGILNNFNLAQYKPNSADAIHLVSEAYRLAYADRAKYVADSDFVNVPVAGLIDGSYLKARSSIIKMDKSMGVPVAGVPVGAVALGDDNSLNLPSTSHMSIVDGNGNVVSMTTTIENGFGSLQMVKGFLLNNQLTDFSFDEKDASGALIANRVQPGKRPRSSMSPTIIFNKNNQVEAIVGSPGGANIIQYVVKTTVGIIDWNMDIQQAINLSNFGAQTSATTSLEKGSLAVAAEAELKARGHTVSILDINSGVHGIVFSRGRSDGSLGLLTRNPDAGTWAGGADPRREGVARGN
jgi:gamma-glutamyltranspeptidase / glutathione hydrolase